MQNDRNMFCVLDLQYNVQKYVKRNVEAIYIQTNLNISWGAPPLSLSLSLILSLKYTYTIIHMQIQYEI